VFDTGMATVLDAFDIADALAEMTGISSARGSPLSPPKWVCEVRLLINNAGIEALGFTCELSPSRGTG
jgi:hypothetical protein